MRGFDIIAVGCGGALGSILRYLACYKFAFEWSLWGFSAGTLLVNCLGSLIIGVLIALLDSERWTWLLVIGLCGGFTTFSTFSMEVVQMLRAQAYGTAVVYALLSVVLCVALTAVGFYLANIFKG